MYIDPQYPREIPPGQAELPCDEYTIRLQCKTYQIHKYAVETLSEFLKTAYKDRDWGKAKVMWCAELGARCRSCHGRWLMKGEGDTVREAVDDLVTNVAKHMIECADEGNEREIGRPW